MISDSRIADLLAESEEEGQLISEFLRRFARKIERESVASLVNVHGDMRIDQAITLARKALFDAGGIYLRDGQMVSEPDADMDAPRRAQAYNVLAEIHGRMNNWWSES